jgi:hypothetical protein
MKKWITATMSGLGSAILFALISAALTSYLVNASFYNPRDPSWVDSAGWAFVFVGPLAAIAIVGLSFAVGVFAFMYTASRF